MTNIAPNSTINSQTRNISSETTENIPLCIQNDLAVPARHPPDDNKVGLFARTTHECFYRRRLHL